MRTVAPQDARAWGRRDGPALASNASPAECRAAPPVASGRVVIARPRNRCAIKPLRGHGVVAEAADVLQRTMDERGSTGTDKLADRLTNALDTEARFGRKGKGNH